MARQQGNSSKNKKHTQKNSDLTIKDKDKKRKKKRNKTKPKRSSLMIFAMIMIGFGVITLLYPIVANFMANRERSLATEVYDKELEQLNEADRLHMLDLAKDYNQELYERQQGISSDSTVDYKTLMGNQSVMGTIEVPALNIKSLPFYHGTSYATLDKGLGHFEASSIPIGGENTRSVITGHSGMRNQVLFTDIRYLKEGDIFFVHILNETLAYQIESFEEVLPSEVERVAIEPGKDMVTLLTCTPPGINTYRLLVNGRRIPYEQAKDATIVRRNVWSYQTIVLGGLAICFVLFLILWIIYRHLVKKSHSKVPEISQKAKKRITYLIYTIRGLFIILLVVMIGVLCLALYGFTQMETEIPIDDISIGENDDLYAYNADKILKANYDTQQIRSVNVSTYAKSLETLQKNVNDWGIGKLVIPSVDINLPILSGLSNDNLLNGVATYQQDQTMGISNYILLAHNLIGANVLLNQIHKIKLGQEIYVTDFKDVYTYKTVRNNVIKETEIEVLDATKKSTVTLIRCEGGIGTVYRRVVQGELVKKEALKDCNSDFLTQLGLEKSQPQSGKIIKKNPLSYWNQLGINFAATAMADPIQTIVPLFLLLLFPIIFLGLIR